MHQVGISNYTVAAKRTEKIPRLNESKVESNVSNTRGSVSSHF